MPEPSYRLPAGLLGGEVSPVQAGAFLIAMRIKGETPAELAGVTQALRDYVDENTANRDWNLASAMVSDTSRSEAEPAAREEVAGPASTIVLQPRSSLVTAPSTNALSCGR